MKVNKLSCKDLMVGDWVKIKTYGISDKFERPEAYIYVKVAEIGSCLITIEHNNDIKVPYRICENTEIEPIPLTAEILEKNGFTGGKYKDYCGFVFYLSADGFREIGLTMSYKDNILWCEKIKPNYPNSFGDKYSIHHLDYVHELQHAMRLCGIEKEIIL